MENQVIQRVEDKQKSFFTFLHLAITSAKEMIGEESSKKNLYLDYLLKEIVFEASMSPIEALDWLKEKAVNSKIIERERTILVCRYALHPDDIEVREMLESDMTMGSQVISTEELSSLIDPTSLSNSYLNAKNKFIQNCISESYPTFLFDAKGLDSLYDDLDEISKGLDFEDRIAFIANLSQNPDMAILKRLDVGMHYAIDPTNPETIKALKENMEEYIPSPVVEEPKTKKFYPYPIK